jgi:signal transduction histidine kinase
MHKISANHVSFLVLFLLLICGHSLYSQDTNFVHKIPEISKEKKLIDSLKLTYAKLSDPARIAQIISDCRTLGYVHPNEINSLIDETLLELRKTNNKRAEIALLFEKNYILTDIYSDFDSSRALSYYMLNNLPVTPEEQIQLLDFIARAHLVKSELVQAQLLYEEALKKLNELENPHSKAHINIYWGVAVTFSESENYHKSSEYYKKCLEEATYLEKHYMITACYQNLASNAGKNEQWNISEAYLDSARNTIGKIENAGDRVMLEMSLLNAHGDLYKRDNKLDSAVMCFKKSFKLSDQYDDFHSKSYAMYSLGSVYLDLNKLDEAEELLLKSHEMFSKKTPALLLESTFNLYRLYKKKGLYAESLKWYEAYATNKEETQKTKNVRIIANATSAYEAELKDKTIALLKNEKIIEEQAKTVYKNRWQIIIILFVLLLLVGAFYLNHNRHQKSRQKIINEVLGEERERKRISMDLHDGICSQITTITRTVKNHELLNDKTWHEKIVNKLDKLNLEIRDISHNLSLIKYDKRSPLKHIIEDYIGDIQEHIPIKFVVTFTPKNKAIFLEHDRELVLYRVIQEICNNAIKHSQTKTMHLSFAQKGQELYVAIEDHGIGFGDSSHGEGINNIYKRVEFLNGKVAISTKTTGSTFNIQIPLKQSEFNQK